MVLIIAEAGVNHNGDIKIAKELIDIASSGGADIIKFQTFTADRLVTKSAEKAEYQKITTNKNESQLNMLKKLELTYGKKIVLLILLNLSLISTNLWLISRL